MVLARRVTEREKYTIDDQPPPQLSPRGARSRNMMPRSCTHAFDRPLRVAIVGGGPGGLFTAWHLERLASSRLDITILEATARLGGKLLTPTFSTAPVRYEAGAAEFYDYSPVDSDPLRNLVRTLGLSVMPLGGSAVHLEGRWLANVDDVGDLFGPAARQALAAFDLRARSAMTPREFYESGSDASPSPLAWHRFDDALAGVTVPSVRRYVETMIHSDLATEPETTSAGYGLQNYLMNDPAYMRLYRIIGGNEQLVQAVAAGLAATVRLEAAVMRVGTAPEGRLSVAWRHAGRVHDEAFDVVVLAVPVGPLAAIEFGAPPLAAAMRRHVVHHDHPAHYLRITLLLEDLVAGVPGADDYLMLDAFAGACLYVENARDPTARHGVLGWLLGGAAARDMATRSDEAIVAAAIAALPAPLANLRSRVLESRVHRWTGAVSAVPGGWLPLPVHRRHRPAGNGHNLFVVGDYLYDSTINGVLDSAEYVAGWVAAEHRCGVQNEATAPGGR